MRPLKAKQLLAQLNVRLTPAQQSAPRKELSFGPGREKENSEEGRGEASDRDRRFEDMLAKRAAQRKDRDRGLTR